MAQPVASKSRSKAPKPAQSSKKAAQSAKTTTPKPGPTATDPSASEESAELDDPLKPRPGSGRFERGGGDSLVWHPGWKRYTVGNGVLTGIALTSLITAYAIGPDQDDAWTAHFSVDESVRDTLRAPSRRGRQIAEDISDVGLSLSISYPFLVDALIVSSWYRDSPDVGAQMALIDAEALAFSTAIQALANLAAGRERPYGRTCGTDLDPNNADCNGSNRYRSFFSGHTSISFTAAAVNCVHHTQMPIYGEGNAFAPCASGFALASLVGAMRIVADFHYLTDVLAGAAVGTGVGIAVPLVLHYKNEPGDEHKPGLGAQPIEVRLIPMPGGLGVAGSF